MNDLALFNQRFVLWRTAIAKPATLFAIVDAVDLAAQLISASTRLQHVAAEVTPMAAEVSQWLSGVKDRLRTMGPAILPGVTVADLALQEFRLSPKNSLSL